MKINRMKLELKKLLTHEEKSAVKVSVSREVSKQIKNRIDIDTVNIVTYSRILYRLPMTIFRDISIKLLGV